MLCKHYPEMKSCKTKHLRMGILHKNRYRSKDSSKNDFHFILPEWKLMKTFFFHGETEFHFTSLVTSSPSPTINLNKFFWTVIDTFEVTLSFFRSFLNLWHTIKQVLSMPFHQAYCLTCIYNCIKFYFWRVRESWLIWA